MIQPRSVSAFLLTVALFLSFPTEGMALQGRATVIDGDTLELHGQRIRLHGIDAPEAGQTCLIDNQPYRCGQEAALALDKKIAGASIRCISKAKDPYERIIAECFAGSQNLNQWMVAQGWALAYRQYSKTYIIDEATARQQRRGLWKGSFEKPWEYRKSRHKANTKPVPAPSATCQIKGNISRQGKRIYHLPGSTSYLQTHINPNQGERWFCSEAEAMKAGWRNAYDK